MNYKAIALDLDGTLTDSKKNVPEDNIKAIDEAIDNGICVILVSGRPPFGIRPVAEKLHLSDKGGFIIACNGSYIIDCKTNEIIYKTYLPDECKKDVCDIARSNGVYALTYYNDLIVGESDDDEYVIKETICNYTSAKKVDNLSEFLTYSIPKFLVVGPHEKLLLVQQGILEKFGDKLDTFFSEDYFLEVVPKGVAKDNSLMWLLPRLGISKEELIACGDGMNDISMLKIAGLAVAMENAYPEVKKYADIIAPSNDACGVADVINKYLI